MDLPPVSNSSQQQSSESENEIQQTIPQKTRRQTAFAWEHFIVLADNTKKCLKCLKIYSTSTSTKVLEDYLNIKHDLFKPVTRTFGPFNSQSMIMILVKLSINKASIFKLIYFCSYYRTLFGHFSDISDI